MNLDEAAIFIIDTETTGLDASRHAACEIAVRRWVPPHSEVPQEPFEWSTLVNPGRSIPREVTQIHGITNAHVRNAPSTAEVFAMLARMIPMNALVLAHNMAFDQKFLDLQGCYLGCTLRLARKTWPEAPSHRNGELARWLDISLDDIRLHRAMADVRITAKIFDRIIQHDVTTTGAYPSFEQLVERATRSGESNTIPFGKYRGKPISEVPTDYLDYALKSWSNADQLLLTALAQERAKR